MTRTTFSIIALLAMAGSAIAQPTAPFEVTPRDIVPEVTAPAGKGDLGGADPAPEPTLQARQAERLNAMFDRLAGATDKRRADRIARNIMRRMSRSGSPTVDLLLIQAAAAMQAKRYGTALDLLDGVVRMEPEFAEGWNRRATVHYMRGDFSASLADIEQVLKREPRHWGALAGLSMILVSIDNKEKAVVIMDEALAIHPHLERMKERRESLIEELEGARI